MGRLFGKLLLLLSVTIVGCQKKSEEAASVAAPKTLYVSTGVCNAGSGSAVLATYTAATASRSIERFASDTGANKGFLMDFTLSNFLPAQSPSSLVDGGDYLYVSIENATTNGERGIWKIPKSDPYNFIKYAANAAAFTGGTSIVRGLARDADGSFYVSTSTKIEKFNTSPSRVSQGANGWIQAPSGNCGTAATTIGPVAVMAPLSPAISGKLIYGHQPATSTIAQQRIGVMGISGFTGGAADCAGGVQISSVVHTRSTTATSSGTVAFSTSGTSPTSMVYIPMPAGSAVTGKLVVSYSNDLRSNNTGALGVYNLNYGIVMWDITESAAPLNVVTINNPVILYDNANVVYAASAMAFDSTDNSLYVSVSGEPGGANTSGNLVGYNIEKFTLDYNAATLTRIAPNNQPFIKGAVNTKCISGIALGE